MGNARILQPLQSPVHVCYRSNKGFFSTTFFNQTIELNDRPRLIDTQFVGLGLIGLSVLAVIGKPRRPSVRPSIHPFLNPFQMHARQA